MERDAPALPSVRRHAKDSDVRQFLEDAFLVLLWACAWAGVFLFGFLLGRIL